MAGKPGHGGRPRKPVAHHILSGHYRPSRHGPRPAATVAFPAPTLAPPVPPQLLRGLRAPGRELVEELWKAYEFSAATFPLLRLIGEWTDRRVEAREGIAAAGLVTTVNGRSSLHALARLEQRSARNLMDLFRQLDLEK